MSGVIGIQRKMEASRDESDGTAGKSGQDSLGEVTSEQRPEGEEGASQVGIWKGQSKCKGPEVGVTWQS